jgi:hypothetical protein
VPRIERLSADHHIEDFSSGNDDLDTWLRTSEALARHPGATATTSCGAGSPARCASATSNAAARIAAARQSSAIAVTADDIRAELDRIGGLLPLP